MSLGDFVGSGTGNKVLCCPLIKYGREVGIPLEDFWDLWDQWEELEAVTTPGGVQGISGPGTHCSTDIKVGIKVGLNPGGLFQSQ